MSKHTPGPWLINRESEDVIEGKLSIESVNAETQLSYFIAQVDGCKSQEANARLIAAAPDLLEALDDAMDMLGSRLIKDTFGYEWHEKASAAIAKAKGDQQ